MVRRHTTMRTARDLQTDGAREQERLARAMRALRRQHVTREAGKIGAKKRSSFCFWRTRSHGPKANEFVFPIFYVFRGSKREAVVGTEPPQQDQR